MSAASN